MGGFGVRIRVLQGFGAYTPGQVFDDWPGGMCEILIARGVIEEVKGDRPAPHIEAAEDEQEVERAEIPARKKRKQ